MLVQRVCVFNLTPPDKKKNHHHKGRISPATPRQLRPEWLTAAVGVWGLCRAILQAVQDLSFAHVAVSHQQELEQVVVALDRAALAAHPDAHRKQGRVMQTLAVSGTKGTLTPPMLLSNPLQTSVIPSTFLRGGPLKQSPKTGGFFTLMSSADSKNVFQRREASLPPHPQR